MSKPLRGIIESTRTRLEDILNNLPDISPEINPELTREENMNVLDRARSQLLHEIQRVKEAIGILDASNTEWGVYMRTLAGEPLAQEEEIYQETIEFSGSFMELIGKGRDELLILQSRLRDTEETQAQLLNPRIFKSALLPNEDGPKVFEEGATVKPIHLPSLQLPTYDGDPLKWSEFWDAYESAIHTQGIPQVQKFTYLISCVKGKAHTAIEGMAITNANYQEAISILKHRFGNINVIKRSLYTQLRKIPISTGKTVDLRSTLEEVDRVCRQLQSVGEDVNQPNLIMTVQEKLPPAILMDLGRYKSPDELWRMDQLRAQLDALVRIREEAWQIAQHAPKTEGNPPQPRVDSKPWKAKPPPQASTNAFAALTTNDDRSNTTLAKLTTIYPCAFCCETHFNDQCVKFPSRESRQERAKELELCFRCLKQGHDARRCRFTRKCIYCQGEHNRALCTNKKSSMDYRSPTASNVNQRINPTQPMKAHAIIKEVEPNETDQEEREENNVMKISIEEKEKKTAPPTRHEVVLLTAKTKAFNPEMKSRKKEAVDVHIFFDSGSQKSFITQELADKLKLKKESEDTLSIYTFASEQPQQMKSSTVQVEVLLKDGSTKTIQASALPMLTNKLPRKALKENDINLYKQASSRNLAEDIPMKNEVIIPDILIGSDYFWEFLESKETIKCPSGLYLIPSKVGILIGGKQETKEKNKNSNMHTILTSAEEKWNFNPKINPSKIAIRNVEEFWSLEAIGIKDSPDTKDDDLALQQLDDTIMFNNGRYNVKWPWKSEFPQLPDNYWLCYGRLKSLMKRFSGETDLLKKYNDIIQDQLAKEIIEKVEEKDEAGPIQHYLPHHPVVTPSKTTTKVRIVYDASAKMNKNSNSLNDCLYRGPVILPDLCGLLMRFRKAPIALTADIEKAFLQVGLQSDDRDVTRFLWLKDLEKPFSKENVQIYRFCRVTFGVISSPFLLSATLQHHLRKSGRKEALELAENIYVDNVLTGKETVEEAQQLYQETKTLFSQVSMNLREWTSNSKEFRDFLPEEDKLKEPKVKVLGLLWNTETDTLQASLAANSKVTSTVTKREVLQTLASTFDPMGMLAPITVRGKIFFQTLWQDKFDWDEPLPKFLANKWQEIMEDWEKHPNFFVPRHIAPQGMNTRYQLLTFVDASKDAYAAVVYLRVEDENSTETYLLFSKNRLTPKKEISLPRVELLAALIGVRIMKFVANQLKLQVEKKIIWSDSQCVLHWIQSSKYLSTFVTNRVKEIRAEDDIHFRYISTDENPADLSSRGVQAARFEDNSLWWHGPKWLKTSTSQWPEWNMPEFQPNILREINNESKGSKFFHEATLMAIETGENYNPVIKTERFSKWPKLLRVTVHCLRFIKLKIWKRLSEETKEKMGQKLKFLDRLKDSGQINANDIKTATIFTLRQNQLQHFPDVFYALQNNKKNQLIDQLGVSLDEEGILRCGGRLSNADKEETMKYPILLPRKTHATQLIIRDRHELALHSGVQHTLAQLRQEFWILKGRIEVRKAIKSCLLCKKYSVGPYNLPKMPAFPKERVQQANPFQYTGLDYLGPLWIKSVNEKFKVWICLFTCLVTRAIHLEPILDLSAQQFLNCIRRFIARRGKPDKIISDNAPHFKLTQKTMDLAWSPIWEDDNNNNYFAQHKIDWQFITEYAPWQGGFYERLVGVVKQALRKTIGRQCLKFEQFYTLLPEVEAVVNSRPLTYLYNDFASRQTLRPIDFLSPRSEIGIPPLEEDHKNAEYLPPGIDSKQRLLQIWKKSVENLDKFWALWHGEYLLSLRERYQTSHKGPRIHATTLPKLEEVVLIKEEGTPRGIWKLGKIIELKKGRDGETRSAKVILPNKTIINRPINLLYPLEISEEQPQHDLTTTPVEKTKTPSVTTTKPVRPTRGPRVDYRNPIKLFYTLGIMLCIIMTGAQGTACREDEDLTQIQSQTCLKEGVIVMRTSQGNLCWIKKTCPTGHLGNNGTCGPFCACPKWAEQCSYYTGPLPNIKGDLVSILNLAKPNVCSFKPDPRCNENPIHTRLHKIQLYNGTTHFVKALELRRAQATTEEFECQGEGPQVGTPEFCETHQCASTGTKFCYYRNHDIVFFVNEDGELPIKAWGSIPVTIYGPKEVPAENPICVECSLKCIQGGIEITMEKNIGQIEACAKPYCYRMSHPKEKEIIQFPTDVVIKSHEIVVKIWSNGYLIKDFGIQCEASPYCEMIQCVFCWDLIGNPQCAPKWTFLVLFAMLYFGSVTLYLLIKILKYGCQCCYYGSYGLWQCLRLLELQISMEGFRLSTKTEKNKCQVKPIELAGCYNCLTGAKLKFECKTDFGEALAH
uniref:Integrase catalytic domain-containing protein n=1 Tax=Plectus sambesii TaxID=2011161 RepID=A0A914WWH6_9BILA